MDSDEIRYLLEKCIQLKYCFYGIFAAENFQMPTRERFFIVNAPPAQYEGSPWMVLLFHKKVCLADPFGIPIQNYQILYSRLVQFHNEVTQVLKPKPGQNQNSNFLRTFLYLYCACDVWLRISFNIENEQ